MNKVKFLENLRKTKITFKMNIVKLVDKYPKMMTLSVTLKFFKKVITRVLRTFARKPGRF